MFAHEFVPGIGGTSSQGGKFRKYLLEGNTGNVKRALYAIRNFARSNEVWADTAISELIECLDSDDWLVVSGATMALFAEASEQTARRALPRLRVVASLATVDREFLLRIIELTERRLGTESAISNVTNS